VNWWCGTIRPGVMSMRKIMRKGAPPASWITSTTTIQVNGGVPDGGDPTSPVLPLPDPPGFSTNGSGSANGPQSPGQTPRQAATQYCQQHGQLSFNIPFTHIPVTISLSATLGPANYSATNDINTVFPVFPGPSGWPLARASISRLMHRPNQQPIRASGLERTSASDILRITMVPKGST
jgi:hypothetical protein